MKLESVMNRTFSNASIIVVALATLIVTGFPSQAEAQSARIEFKLFKVGLILGAGGGDGVLIYKGKRYPLSVGGVSLGASIGISSADMVGVVSNLKQASDIAGTYSATSSGIAVAGGGAVATLKNARGVVIKAQGKQVGLAVGVNLNGLTISLK